MGYDALSFPYSAELFLYKLLVKFYGMRSSHLIAPPEYNAMLFIKELEYILYSQ